MQGDTPAARLKRVLVGVTVTTWSTAIHVGLLTSPALIAAIDRSPSAGGYAIVAVVAFSLYFATHDVLESDESDDTLELGRFAEQAVGLLAIAYFNVLVLFAVAFATVAGPTWGIAVAALYPIGDARAVDWVPLTVSGVAVLMMVGIAKLSALSPSVTWRDLRPPRPQIQATGRIPRR